MEGWHWLPTWLHILSLVGFFIGFVYALWHSFSRVAWPTRADAIRHMEIKSGLAHRPISSYEDQAAKRQGHELDRESRVLWDRHQDRLREQIRSVRAGWPDSDLPRQDQTALRFLIVLLLLLAVIRSGLDFPDKLELAFNPTMTSAATMTVTVDAWVNPPAYTGIAPIFLTRPEFLDQIRSVNRFEVPEGSEFYVRVQGMPIKPELIATMALLASDSPDNIALSSTVSSSFARSWTAPLISAFRDASFSSSASSIMASTSSPFL